MAAEIPVSECEPESYLPSTNTIFTLQVPTIDRVRRLLETIDEKRSVGLDKIPFKLLKIAAYLQKLFILEYFHMNGRKLE